MRSVIGYNNYVLESALITSSSGLPISNLQNEIGSPSVGWQTAPGVLTSAGGANFTITPTLTAQTWRAAGVFRTNLTPAATVTFTFYRNSSQVYSWSGQGPYPGYGQVIHIALDDIIADFCRVDFSDPSNPDGFINIPLCFAGPVWIPLSAPSYDTTIGSDSQADDITSRGGQEYRNLLWTRRRMEIAMAGIRATEVLSGWAPLDLVARNGNNILFVPDKDSDTLNQQAIYGRMTSTADIGFPYAASDRRSWRARITERL